MILFDLQLGGGLHDPAIERGHIGIDSGVARPGTAIAPGDDADKLVVGHQRATGITLAGVLLLGVGTDHGILDGVAVAVFVAFTIRLLQEVHGHAHQGIGGGTEQEAGGAPAGDNSLGSGGGSGVGEFDEADLAGLADGGAELDDGHIVDHQFAVVALVELEGPHTDHLTAVAPGGGAEADL